MNFSGGLPETACGKGSTVEATNQLRSALPALLSDIGCRVLVDAPCGDMNWMSAVDLSGIDYVGVDLSDKIELATAASARLRAKSIMLEASDIIASGFPPGNVLLCRDFLQHLPMPMVLHVLQHAADSDGRWLLVSSSREVSSNDEDIHRLGAFRPLNLRLPPFSWRPVATIKDGAGELLLIDVADLRLQRRAA